MRRSLLARTRLGAVVMALVATLASAGASVAAPPSVQALPSPLAFVSNLDLECFPTSPYTPPAVAITTRHLNPVLTGLPVETHVLGAREKLCVPVAKNGKIPPPDVLDFVRFVDLSCYRIQGQTVNYPLVLTHLNPLLANLPAKNTVMVAPEHLCLPVIKNGVVPPPEVLDLVRYLDLKCYRVTNNTPLNMGLNLTQLNPVLGHLPPVDVAVLYARQLCVPVQKNNQAIPSATFNIVRWVDLEMYDITTHQLPAPVTLNLRHINPLLLNLPAETATIQFGTQLGLPVAKNNVMPPSPGPIG